DGPLPPDPSEAWHDAHAFPQISRPRTRAGSADPSSDPGTAGGAVQHAPRAAIVKSIARWGRIGRRRY
ncbi:MAG: hypothetical protein QF844_10945, partial [Acidimicrobiales bacterium]|nr:hypothetical protein [Acidimicrobiales bacterium]